MPWKANMCRAGEFVCPEKRVYLGDNKGRYGILGSIGPRSMYGIMRLQILVLAVANMEVDGVCGHCGH